MKDTRFKLIHVTVKLTYIHPTYKDMPTSLNSIEDHHTIANILSKGNTNTGTLVSFKDGGYLSVDMENV